MRNSSIITMFSSSIRSCLLRHSPPGWKSWMRRAASASRRATSPVARRGWHSPERAGRRGRRGSPRRLQHPLTGGGSRRNPSAVTSKEDGSNTRTTAHRSAGARLRRPTGGHRQTSMAPFRRTSCRGARSYHAGNTSGALPRLCPGGMCVTRVRGPRLSRNLACRYNYIDDFASSCPLGGNECPVLRVCIGWSSVDVFSAGGLFESGDRWVFAARTADASVEFWITCRPAASTIIMRGSAFTRRAVSRPIAAFSGRRRSAQVTAHARSASARNRGSSAPSLQQAIDTVVAKGGGTVCLEIGDYELRAP